jgi:hypothetical protein
VESEPKVDARAEAENAEAAIEEERRTGRTERRCLRDGGHLIFEDYGPGYVIRCENGDYKLTVRGI